MTTRDAFRTNGSLPVLGYLASNGVLYCSSGCAALAGWPEARGIDQDDFDALCEGDGPAPVSLCPHCGEPFPVEWDDRGAD